MSNAIGMEFLRGTRFSAMDPSAQTQGLPQPPLQLGHDSAASTIELPEPGAAEVAPMTVRDAISNRKSLRQYTDAPLGMPELSYLLWCTQGVKRLTGAATFRTVPSAGARHCFETYILANRVDGLDEGLYRFLALEHKLLVVNRNPGIRGQIVAGCLGQKFVGDCAAAFIWAADAYRMTWRYGERGYRYMFLDAGHVCQNLYLAAETVKCGVCAVGAFDDNALNGALGLDGAGEFAVYAAAVGKRGY